MSTKYFETKNVVVEHDEELNAASITFKDTVSSEQYRAAMEKNYELCQRSDIKNWYQNNRDAGVLSLEDQKWVSTDLIPRASKHVEKIAVIVSKDVFRKFAAQNILNKEKGKLNFEYFDSRDEAKKWLDA